MRGSGNNQNWLIRDGIIPTVRAWLQQELGGVRQLIEPFAGGSIVSLTAAFEQLSDRIIMVEKDEEIASVWETILSDKNQWLAEKIYRFSLNLNNINTELTKQNKRLEDTAFCTILKNRIFHGGILAKGSGLIKNGKNGKGLTSRWYAKTLHDRIIAINIIKDKISFITGDGFSVMENNMNNPEAYFFIDPPYTVAGRRLYTHFDIDHENLFKLTSRLRGRFMMTYDNSEVIRNLAEKYDLQYRTIPMKTTHHLQKDEMIISDNFAWWP